MSDSFLSASGRSVLASLAAAILSLLAPLLQQERGSAFEEKDLEVSGGERLAIADLDGGSRLDMAVIGRSSEWPSKGAVTPVLQDATGGFRAGSMLPLPILATAAATATSTAISTSTLR